MYFISSEVMFVLSNYSDFCSLSVQDVGGWILVRWVEVMWTGLVWLRIRTGGELL
jgi:hypothetical protein